MSKLLLKGGRKPSLQKQLWIAEDRSANTPLSPRPRLRVGGDGCVWMLICWPAGKELRPQGLCLRIMSEATCIWMNKFIELSYCWLSVAELGWG